MSITVERLYRVTINETALTLSGDEAQRLALCLVSALGTDTESYGNETDHTFAAVSAPPTLPPWPLSLAPASEPARDARPESHSPLSRTARFSGTPWMDADTERLRVLAGEGMTGPQIAAVMSRPKGTIGSQAAKHHISLGGGKRGRRAAETDGGDAAPEDTAPIAPLPAAVPAAVPVVSLPNAAIPPEPVVEPVAIAPSTASPAPRVVTIREADPLAEQVLTGALRDWTLADTKALVRHMAGATTTREMNACAEQAAATLGRTAMSCKNRWGHLKKAGQMTIQRYLSDPESLPVSESEVA